jgi:hypothetical protein
MSGRFDCEQLTLKGVVPRVKLVSGIIDGGEGLQPVTRQQASEVILALDVRKLESTRRNGSSKVVVPVVIVR